MKLEPFLYIALVALFSALLALEGRRNTDLESRVALTPAALWKKLSRSQVKVQLVDAREELSEYEDTHVPGAIPFPGCDPSKAPAAARDRIYPYLQTVVVTSEGDADTFQKCRPHFTLAWNLAGGMAAWSDASLPEDSGEYSPPKSSAGGGCL